MAALEVSLLAVVSPSPEAEPFDPSSVEPGVIGLAFFLVMGVVVALLVRSMRNRLNNIDVDRHRREQAARKEDEDDGGEGPVRNGE